LKIGNFKNSIARGFVVLRKRGRVCGEKREKKGKRATGRTFSPILFLLNSNSVKVKKRKIRGKKTVGDSGVPRLWSDGERSGKRGRTFLAKLVPWAVANRKEKKNPWRKKKPASMDALSSPKEKKEPGRKKKRGGKPSCPTFPH